MDRTSAAIITDQAERDLALDVTRSFIVQAPAGSGKTSLLVARYLALLARARKPEEVVAITFTRKAAAEMRKRVLEKLEEGTAPALSAGEVAHRLRIETIDAFCMSLARQLPVPAQFGVPPGIVEDADALYREAAAATLALLERKEYGDKVAQLLRHLDNNVASATTLLAAMLAKRDQWLRKTGTAPTRAELERALVAERGRLVEKARRLDERASEEFALDVLTQKLTFNKKKAHARALEGNEALRLALISLRSLPPERYTDDQWAVLEAMLALLPVAAAQLKLVFAARGEADFTEIAQGAVRALGSVEDPSDLLLALDGRINHILVDEFQDTSISQWELLERLTAGWTRDEEGRGAERSLFVVGDPMQSIYRFREANVALFLRARREGLPNVKLVPLALKTNFRSQAGLVDWFNASFARILPEAEDETSGAVPYSSAASAHPALPGEAATWHCFREPAAEAAKVVEIVREARGGGSAALLIRNRSALAEIVPALRAAGVRYRAIEIETLGEKQVVQDLFALTRALTHLADRVAWLAILRAPWTGLSLQELSSLFENKRETIWELIQLVPALARFRSILAPALANRQRGTLRDRVEGVWLALGGPACVADPTDLEDAEVYLDALEQLEEAGEVDFARLAEALGDLYAQPDLAAGESDLQIMTIHKAKGLEFDTVIVAGLHRPPGSGTPPLLLWREVARGGLLLAPIKETGAEDEPAYRYLNALEREAEDTEASRLLYVAATRAISRLHLLGCVEVNKEGETRPLGKNHKRSLLGRAWAIVSRHLPDPLPEGAQPAEARLPPQTLRRLAADFRLPAAPAPAQWTVPAEPRAAQQIEFSWVGETARHIGTVVHRWLQRIGDDALAGWDAKRVESLRPHFERDLHRRGVDAAGPAAEVVVKALKRALADERGRWILGPHPAARTEYRIRTPLGRYVIDRLITDVNGTRWVIDHKTGYREGADVEAFLDSERERYAPQLNAYATALGGAKRGLYFPLHGGWREIQD